MDTATPKKKKKKNAERGHGYGNSLIGGYFGCVKTV